jgi:nicotinate-nucleotide pyrophosphorylase (carboxylating)
MRVEDYNEVVQRALAEDLAELGDITSRSILPEDSTSRGDIVARASGVIAGLEVAGHVFTVVDPEIAFEALSTEGARVDAGSVVATVVGPSRSILTAERTALNLAGRMSGVATATAELAEAVAGTGARITDTRKTMPGLRALDKYAVVAGGGVNHRMGLYDQVMIKDNHIAAIGDIEQAVAAAREANGDQVAVTVEVENLDQLAVALKTSASRVLLDNMTPEMLRRAVAMVDGTMETEASGGVTADTVRAIAESGVDYISVGWITHSAPQLDLALELA